jgi:hypothetical protein
MMFGGSATRGKAGIASPNSTGLNSLQSVLPSPYRGRPPLKKRSVPTVGKLPEVNYDQTCRLDGFLTPF